MSLGHSSFSYLRSCVSISSYFFLFFLSSLSPFLHLYIYITLSFPPFFTSTFLPPFYLLLSPFLNCYAFIHLCNFLIYSLFVSLFLPFQILFPSTVPSVLQSIFMFFPFCAFLFSCPFLSLFLLFFHYLNIFHFFSSISFLFFNFSPFMHSSTCYIFDFISAILPPLFTRLPLSFTPFLTSPPDHMFPPSV